MSDSSIKFCFFQRIKITYFASCSLLFICSIPCSKRVLYMQRKKNIYSNRSMSINSWNQVHIRTFSLNLTELVTMLLIVMKITNLSEFSSSGGWGAGFVFCCLRTLCTRVWKHQANNTIRYRLQKKRIFSIQNNPQSQRAQDPHWEVEVVRKKNSKRIVIFEEVFGAQHIILLSTSSAWFGINPVSKN